MKLMGSNERAQLPESPSEFAMPSAFFFREQNAQYGVLLLLATANVDGEDFA